MLERKYLVVGVRVESKDIISMELLDEASAPPVVETAVLRLSKERFAALGKPTAESRLTLKIETFKQEP